MPGLTPWPLLCNVRHFSIQILTCAGEGAQTSQAGSGHLQVEHIDAPDRTAVIWRERGRWISGPLAGIQFHNSSAWRKLPGGQAIELSHLRRGDSDPTFLVRLEPTAFGPWASTAPHACGADRYSATLDWDPLGLRLTWDVQSPSAPYRLLLDARLPAPRRTP